MNGTIEMASAGDELATLQPAETAAPQPTSQRCSAGLDSERSSLISALFDHSPFAQFVVAADGHIASWNAAAEDLLGYSAAEIVGQSSSLLMPTHFLQLWQRARQRISRDRVVNIDSVRRHRNGHLIEVAVTAIAIGPPDHDAPSYLIVLQDKRRQRQVERENEHLAAFVRHSPLAVVGVDPDGMIDSWNAAATKLFGYTTVEAVGQSLTMLFPKSSPADEVGLGSKLAADSVIEQEAMRATKEGLVIPVSIISAPIINSSGAVIGRANFYKDITERIEAERSLRESETFSRSVIETSPDWIAVLDPDSRILYQNQSGEAETGHSFAPMSAERVSWLDAWPSSELPAMAACLAQAQEHGHSRTAAKRLCADGRTRWYDVQLTRLPAPSGDRRLLVNARDITQRKASDDHISLVNRELSHRAKNLLTVIMAMARCTATEATSASAFTEAFYARLYGLARSHDLLVNHNWIGADLHSLVMQQLKPFADGASHRLCVTGENILLPPAGAQCLGMALHELATNSVKYGALSVAGGSVTVSCEVAGDGHLVTWSESGGPVVAPPTRRGFGVVVVEDMVSECIGTQARLNFAPTGLSWSVVVPRAAGASMAEVAG
jgi:PAS domain S-box-containing protein